MNFRNTLDSLALFLSHLFPHGPSSTLRRPPPGLRPPLRPAAGVGDDHRRGLDRGPSHLLLDRGHVWRQGARRRGEEGAATLPKCPSPIVTPLIHPNAPSCYSLPAVSFPCSSAPSSRRHSRLPIRASALAGGAISPSKRDGFHSQHFVIILRGRQTFFFFFLPSQPRPPTQNATQLIPAQRIHFRKEDERLLRKLLAKVKAQADTVS